MFKRKGGGGQGLFVQCSKNCTFIIRRLPYSVRPKLTARQDLHYMKWELDNRSADRQTVQQNRNLVCSSPGPRHHWNTDTDGRTDGLKVEVRKRISKTNMKLLILNYYRTCLRKDWQWFDNALFEAERQNGEAGLSREAEKQWSPESIDRRDLWTVI